MRRLLIGIGVIASLTGSWWGAAEAQAAQGGPRYSVGTTRATEMGTKAAVV